MVFDKHRSSTHPAFHANEQKTKAREQVVVAYQKITGQHSIPKDRNYWTLCSWQPNSRGAEIIQLVSCGLLDKSQFCGVDYDLKDEGIIKFNKENHPEANWFRGDWLEVIDEHYEHFRPALIYLDYTRTVKSAQAHRCVARTMNMCPSGTVLAANLMLSDGHSRRRFTPDLLIKNLNSYLVYPQDWQCFSVYYAYKMSRTEMGTYIFWRK